MTWSPYAPDAQGLGWFSTREPDVQIEGYTAGAAALRNGAQATEDIAAVWAFLNRTGVTPDDGYEISIYDLDDLTEGDTETLTVRPDDDGTVTKTIAWSESGGTQAFNLYAAIDQATNVAGTYQGRTIPNRSFVAPLYGEGGEFTAIYSTLSGALTGRSISAVRLEALAAELILVAARNPVGGATFTPVLVIAGTQYLGDPTMVPSTGSPTPVASEWLANPATGRSWTPADLDQFATGESTAGWLIGATGSANNLPVLYQGWMEVDSAPTEKRLAVSVVRPGQDLRGQWIRFELLDPDDGTPAPWPKTAGDRPLLVLRRRWGTGWVLWRRLTGDGTYPNGWANGIPNIGLSGRLAALADGNAAALGSIDEPGAFGLILERDTDGASSIDSQPYISVNDDVSGRSGFYNYWTRVDAAQDLVQKFTPASTVDVGYLRVLACLEDPEATDDLTVELINAGTLAVLSTVTFPVDDLGDAPTTFQVLADYLPAEVELTGSTQYALRFTCPAESAHGWRVQVLSCGRIGGPTLTPTDVGDIDFADGTDGLTVGATEYLELTAAAQVHTLPDPPTGLTATDTGAWHLELAWTPAAVSGGGGFRAYEIQRSDGRTDWQTVNYLSDVDADTWEDTEPRLDAVSSYRIRTLRWDGSASPWSDTATATCVGPDCGYVLSSNLVPDRTAWYDTIGAAVTLEMPEQVAIYQPIGANGSIALRELEDRLDAFELTFFVAGRGALDGTPTTPATPGQQAFDDLRVLIGNRRDPDTGRKVWTPYVAVRAPGTGDRWFASITAPRGARSEPDGSYTLTAQITELTDRPAVDTTEPAALS